METAHARPAAKVPAKSSAALDDSASGIDRRRSTREPVITVGMLRELDGDIEFADAMQVLITDVSLHGVGFRAPQKLNSDSIYMIAIGVGPLHLSSRLKLVRVRPRNDGTYDVGAEFC